MPSRLPAGCSIEWTKNPERQDRLLDWLQTHPLEQECLFIATPGRRPGKVKCSNLAAQAIFAQDGSPANGVAVKKDPTPFGRAILNLIRTQWRPKYQQFNEAVGQAAARLPYADFQPNSDAKKIADAAMIKFPQWARLHNFWRLMPEYNQFADKGVERFVGSPQSTGRKRKKARDVEDSDLPEDSDESYSSLKPVEQPRARFKIGPPGGRAKRIKRSSKLSKPSHLVKTEDKAMIIDLEEDEPERSQASTSTAVFLTQDRQHEKEMAELRLRTIEAERKAKDQENEALKEKHKHEAFMAAYGAPKL